MTKGVNIFEAAYHVMAKALYEEFGGKVGPSTVLQKTALNSRLEMKYEGLGREKEFKDQYLMSLNPLHIDLLDNKFTWSLLSYSTKKEDIVGCIFHYPLEQKEMMELSCGLLVDCELIDFMHCAPRIGLITLQPFPFSNSCLDDIIQDSLATAHWKDAIEEHPKMIELAHILINLTNDILVRPLPDDILV